jgi:hypothetical protein
MSTWQQYPQNGPDKMWRRDWLPVILAPLPKETHWYDVVMALWDEGRWIVMDHNLDDVDITDRVVAFIEPPREAKEWAQKRKEELG